MSSAATDAMAGGSDFSYRLDVVELGEQQARADVVVVEELRRPRGAAHAGVYAAIAEELTSIATARAIGRGRALLAPLSNQTSFLLPITEGTIHAVAEAKHRGRTTWVWEVEFSDDQGRLCVLTRITMAVSAA